MIPEIVQVIHMDDYKVNVYFDDGKILVGRWKNKDNPYNSILFRNEYGQLQALKKEK